MLFPIFTYAYARYEEFLQDFLNDGNFYQTLENQKTFFQNFFAHRPQN